MKKILLTGVNGQVGHVLEKRLAKKYTLTALSREKLDLTNADQIRECVQLVKPDIIINPAAYTAVDQAESEPELAYAVNAKAPKALAEEGQKIGAAMIHFSTDYVFDGSKLSAYQETDQVSPLGVYGKTKLAGEEAVQSAGLPHLILRTSWVYGVYGKNFFHTVLRLASERDSLKIVADQIGAPTSTFSIADGILDLLNAWDVSDETQSGIYHFTNNGSGSWHRFASEIVHLYYQYAKTYEMPALKASTAAIAPITTQEFPTPAARPENSRLDNTKLAETFDVALPLWKTALEEVMQGYIAEKQFKRIA